MYVTGEDFYFLTYNLILILNQLKCYEERMFRDHRKLALLVSFVARPRLINILETHASVGKLNHEDTDVISQCHDESLIVAKNLNRLLFSLEQKEIINLRHDETGRLDISLKRRDYEFLREPEFEIERNNLETLRRRIQRIQTLSYDTLVERLILGLGARAWRF